MFCTKCGAQIPVGSSFCPACGQKVEANSNKSGGGKGFFGLSSGVGDSIKKTAGGLFQGISESYNSVKKTI